VSILALLAGLLGWRSEQQRRIAEQQKAVAEGQRAQADDILARAVNVIQNLPSQRNTNTWKQIFGVFQAGAEHGDAASMTGLGSLYHHGKGLEQDYAKAREWFEKAADTGDADAIAYRSISEAAGAGRYGEALQLQEALSAKVEEDEIKRNGGKPGEDTAEALVSVAWYALLARDFIKALTVADRAHAIFPNDLGIETNRAHALMFVENEKEAKGLYFAHKGKPLSEEDAMLWERVIAEDFAEFRKAGLTHPVMAEIEKELGVSQ